MNINDVLKLVQEQATEWEIKLCEIAPSSSGNRGYEDYLELSNQVANIIKRLRNVERKLEIRKYESLSRKTPRADIFTDLMCKHYHSTNV